MKVVHSWLKEYVGDSLPSAEALEELLTFHAFEIDGVDTVEGEDVIDIDVLPNRSSDCLCHRGIAREIATITNEPLKYDPLREPVELTPTEQITVEIEDATACPRFTASLITGIEVKDSPEWLQQRLRALGQRPINNIVDATNYVMYAIGQPLHAYDADLFPRIDGKWQFQVRFAKEGEQVSLIPEGGKEEDRIIECQGSELLIIDQSSDMPIGLAGVKGGRYAGVHAGTKSVIIEAAHFHPTITRKTARRLGIVIDASKRFENEPSRELPLYAQRDIIALITSIAGGSCEGVVDHFLAPRVDVPVTVTTKKTNALLGLSLAPAEIQAIIERTGSRIVENQGDSFVVVGPWERTDLTIEEDFVEEVGRIYGLGNIASVIPESVPLKAVNQKHFYSELIRRTLVARGFSEVITTSFQKKGRIQLQNALASDKSYMREKLSKNLTAVMDANFSHLDLLGIDDIRVFEIGTVFEKGENGIEEHFSLALGVRTKGSGYSPKDDRLLEEVQAELAAVLGSKIDWQAENGVAETNLDTLIEQLPIPASYAEHPAASFVQYRAPSPYPAISRDIAMWVGVDVTAQAAQRVLEEAAGPLRVRTRLFDEFSKDGRTSFAFRLVFQSPEKTLTDEEVGEQMEVVYSAVAQAGFEVR